MKKLGERIKKRRNQLELSLMELAKKIDVTSSLLSQIENGKAYPSIVTLKSIADAINVTVSELIGENETCVNNPVIQKTERKLLKINHQNASLHTTPQNPFYHNFEVFYMTLKKEGNSEHLLEFQSGKCFCQVLTGKVAFEIKDGYFTLKAGDSIFFNASHLRNIRNFSPEESEVLWVIHKED